MRNKGLEIVQEHSLAGLKAREDFFGQNAQTLVRISKVIALSLAGGGKVLLCGNGGSAADAQHLAAEFVNRFLMERPPLPAIALTTDTSILTAVSNDYAFNQVFVKQVKALGRSGDVLLGISTSGNSANVNQALAVALDMRITTVGLCGGDGGAMLEYCNHLLMVEETSTPIIQEIHIAAGHLICRLVDHFLFEAVNELRSLED